MYIALQALDPIWQVYLGLESGRASVTRLNHFLSVVMAR
jgi:hypothetical protein